MSGSEEISRSVLDEQGIKTPCSHLGVPCHHSGPSMFFTTDMVSMTRVNAVVKLSAIILQLKGCEIIADGLQSCGKDCFTSF